MCVMFHYEERSGEGFFGYMLKDGEDVIEVEEEIVMENNNPPLEQVELQIIDSHDMENPQSPNNVEEKSEEERSMEMEVR